MTAVLPALALAPLTLAAVLVLSGVAKLPDPRSTHSMMTVLGLPRALANRTVARLLPWGELAVAALLLTPWRWTFALGALAAVLLFLAYWVVVALAMRLDPRPSCPCFGRVGDHRITWRTVLRNTLLLALALLTAGCALLGRTGTGLLAGFGTGDWVWLLLAAVLAVVAVLVLGRGPDDLGAATPPPAPPIASPVADGLLVGRDHEVVPVHRLTRQGPRLLVLVDCWCGSTFAVLDRLPGWRDRLPDLDPQLVHTRPPWDEPRLAGVPGVWWDPGARLSGTLGAGPSPTAVVVDTGGALTAGPVSGVEAVAGLVDELAGLRAPDAP